MNKLINQIFEIIKDYRVNSDSIITHERILKWVNQFDENDQEFILKELLHILPNSYISKANTIETVGQSFEYLRNKYDEISIEEFLLHAKFLSCQQPHKSQTKILEFIEEQLIEKHQLDLNSVGSKGQKYWIYFDDVLASGGTFRREIKNEIETYGTDKFKKENIKIVAIFFFLHSWGYSNSKFIFLQDFGKDVVNQIDFLQVHEIQNNPRINRFNSNPNFNHVFPKKQNNQWEEYLETLDVERNREFAFRPNNLPLNENFFSSPENRDRYEKIILEKGMEIINRVENIGSSVRPLGLTSPSFKTFGTGGHAFTWRNISNTCPLVFWWESNGWYPLFSVENRGN